MASCLSSSAVVLKDGLSVSLEALQLAWRLEDAGVVLVLGENDRLRAGPPAKLSEPDRAPIRAHRDELMAVVRYSCGVAG